MTFLSMLFKKVAGNFTPRSRYSPALNGSHVRASSWLFDYTQYFHPFFLYICYGVSNCGSVVLNVSPLPSMERKKQEL
jgi:hypothetical protein